MENVKLDILRNIHTEEFETYRNKNHDYGDAFAELRKRHPSAILVRLYDKYMRLETLFQREAEARVSDESIEDTLIDLANYANLELLERRLERLEGSDNNGSDETGIRKVSGFH